MTLFECQITFNQKSHQIQFFFLSFCFVLVYAIMWLEYSSLFLAALFWGTTNPFIKQGSEGLKKIEKRYSNPLVQIFYEIIWLFTQWRYFLPFLLNQFGSVFFYHGLSQHDLSIASPITNGLTFIITAIVSSLLGETKLTPKCALGVICVLIGCHLMITTNQNMEKEIT
jgi:drug/metabolite transporter (DMT)-like permease